MITVIFGPPGSGKGTQAQALAARLDVPHVSTGEILRREVDTGSALGQEAQPIIETGKLISDDLMVRVIEARLSQPDASHGALLDGFPRTVAQAEALDAMLKRRGDGISCVVALEVQEDELVQRITRRGEAEGRSDDTVDALKVRLVVFWRDTAPVLDYYARRHTAVLRVDGNGSVLEVGQRIVDGLNSCSDGVAL